MTKFERAIKTLECSDKGLASHECALLHPDFYGSDIMELGENREERHYAFASILAGEHFNGE